MSKVFPKWINSLPLQIIIFLFIFGGTLTAGITYYFTPKYTRVGYAPEQPVPFQHSLHAGQLGIDCRYCHSHVERSEHANIPTSQTCMACHSQILTDSPLLEPVRESLETGEPVPWVRVHKTPDYVFFNHAVHVNRGVSCFECHGQVNEMDVVAVQKPLSMAWCLECHRNPEQRLRPPEEVFNLDWRAPSAEAQKEMGEKFVHDWKVMPPESCSGCHR